MTKSEFEKTVRARISSYSVEFSYSTGQATITAVKRESSGVRWHIYLSETLLQALSSLGHIVNFTLTTDGVLSTTILTLAISLTD